MYVNKPAEISKHLDQRGDIHLRRETKNDNDDRPFKKDPTAYESDDLRKRVGKKL